MPKYPFGIKPVNPETLFGIGPQSTPRKGFKQRDRTSVWDKEFGPDVDRIKCPICKTNEIARHHFAMGHKKSLKNKGTNNLRNIRPICHQCNSQMGTMDMSEYIRRYHSTKVPQKTNRAASKPRVTISKKPKIKKTKSTRKTTRKRASSSPIDSINESTRRFQRDMNRVHRSLGF